MQLFIDSANPVEIKQCLEWGIIDGVTTNPTLAAKAGIKFKDAAPQILEMVKGPVSLEVLSLDTEGMLREGRALAKMGEQVIVKLPTTFEGLRALKVLHSEGIKTNLTLVFSVTQALLVAKLGATYVSPFGGRLDDIMPDSGIDLTSQIKTVYENYGYETHVLFASVRSVSHVREAALIGSDVATCPFGVLEQLIKHPLTDKGLDQFKKDWEASGQEALV